MSPAPTLPWFILAVISLSFLLLMTVSRSVLAPLKARLDLLSIGAACGLIVDVGDTAKEITAAALIMIGVFLGFVAGDGPVVKMMGVGLATAVAVAATIVHMVLVPSTTTLVGAGQLVAGKSAGPSPPRNQP